MSVLIKGAKPPNGCRWCYFSEDSKCALIVGCDFDDTNGWKRRKDCPLIELPDHGDLIDRDELMMKMWEASAYAPNHCSWVNARVVFAKDVEDAPVVIPAERSEDD